MKHRNHVLYLQTVGAILLIGMASARAGAPTVTLDEARSGSLLFASETPGRHVPAPLLATEAEIVVSGPVARVRVRQNFINPVKSWLEARYVFPLPETAAVDSMVLTSGDTKIVADIRERAAARKLYQDAKRDGKRAALIEQHRPNLFTTAVANIGPLATVTVEITYLQRIRFDQGSFRLRFPMVVAPRFNPDGPVRMVAAGTPPVEPWMGTPVRHPDDGPANPVRLTVRLDAGVPLAALRSPHHAINADDWHDGDAVVTLAKGPVPADRDFELVWTPVAGALPATALFAEQTADETYVMAMVLPPAPGDHAPPPRDVVFVLDRSGSMAGKSIVQARAALIFALDRLRPIDRFEIIRFNNKTDVLFGGLRKVGPDTLARARAYVGGTEANGGTMMRPALLGALDTAAGDRRLRQVVFLTDGAVSNESALFDEIAARIGTTRLFTVGIGSAPNSHFMRRAAELGRGSFTYIGNTENVGERMRALLRKIERPAMIDLAAEWLGLAGGAAPDSYPGRLPDLFDGEPLVLTARLRGGDALAAGAVLALSGRRGDMAWHAPTPLDVARPGKGIGALWARSRIADLMSSLHRGADRDSVRQAVTATALRHKLVSQYTSLVAVEQKISRPVDEPLYVRDVARNLPDGWVYEKVFGGQLKRAADMKQRAAFKPSGAPPAAVQAALPARALHAQGVSGPSASTAQVPIRLPATATTGPIQLLAGIAALLAAAGLLTAWRRR